MLFRSTVKIKDVEGNLVTVREGSISKIQVGDDIQIELLGQVLIELKKMNLQLMMITDMNINDTEVE